MSEVLQGDLYKPADDTPDMYFVECGQHFSASGPDGETVRLMLMDHNTVCSDRPARVPTPNRPWVGTAEVMKWLIGGIVIIVVVAIQKGIYPW